MDKTDQCADAVDILMEECLRVSVFGVERGGFFFLFGVRTEVPGAPACARLCCCLSF